VANLPVCLPSRHSFITGMYPHQLGILSNMHYWPGEPPVPTLGTRLQGAGYRTAAIGKMHWKSPHAPMDHVPNKRGFDTRISFLPSSFEGPLDLHGPSQLPPEERQRQTGNGAYGPGGETRRGYVGDVASAPSEQLVDGWTASRAVEFLRDHAANHRGKPFLLMVNLDRPHAPGVVPSDFADLYNPASMPLPPPGAPATAEEDSHLASQTATNGWNEMTDDEMRQSVARYLANVTYVDHCFGRVLDELTAQGLAGDTAVIFTSDHGELMGERRRAYSKYSLYESAIRVPLVVRWPGVSRAGSGSSAPVELVDLLPTCLDAAGQALDPMLPGRTLRPLLEGHDPAAAGWREATISELHTGGQVQWAVRSARHKLIVRTKDQSALYDLETDPGEFDNRIEDAALAGTREHLETHLHTRLMMNARQFARRPDDLVAVAGDG